MMDFLSNILSGGLLGVFTSAFSTWFKFRELKESHKFSLSKIKAQSEASIREIEAQVKVQEVVTEGAMRLEESKADTAESIGRSSLIQTLTGKYLSDNTLEIMLEDTSWVGIVFKPLIYLHVLLMDAIRGLIRPVLTIGIVGYIAYVVNLSLDKYLVSGSRDELMLMVIKPSIQLLLFSASTVIGFWFADKAMSRRFQKGNNNGR